MRVYVEFPALVRLIGSWRVRHEGWENAEESHAFWDRIVRWLS